jgi:LmbE family N-acetylglucosaminyl deacetylase
MKNIQERLADRRVGLVLAHPDDNIIAVNAVQAGLDVGAEFHELTVTLGKRGKNLRLGEPGFVLNGGRAGENGHGARHLGIRGVTHYDYPDRAVAQYTPELVPQVGSWLVQHEIEVLLTLGDLDDHDDHRAIAAIARQAALASAGRTALREMFELRQYGNGEWVAPSTPDNIRVAFESASYQASQLLVARTVMPGWVAISEDLSVHPDTLAELDTYPIRRDATYDYVAIEELQLVAAGTTNNTVY